MGIRGTGGSTAGLSKITVYFGGYSSSTWSGSLHVNGPRSYGAGKFMVFWNGGQNGECAGQSHGSALNVGAPATSPQPADRLYGRIREPGVVLLPAAERNSLTTASIRSCIGPWG
ncbi:hypothetical protein [Luethyella okanaganae]|uniref:Uncharacterized protein n=1 Tax=Luethyella okanaganae TaxID=69372 RepID=A0ABW1VA39_9MICO